VRVISDGGRLSKSEIALTLSLSRITTRGDPSSGVQQVKLLAALFAFGLLAFPGLVRAAWSNPAWLYRRPLTVTWDAEHATGTELATAEFYTAGHASPEHVTPGHTSPAAADFRVTTADGDPLPSHILMQGPGDRVLLIFALRKGIRDYDVYFGNPQPPPISPNLADVHYTAGLRIETKLWTGGPLNSFADNDRSWQRSHPSLGVAMIDAALLGYNPFGEQDRTISLITGTFYAPQSGSYSFAMSVDDEGALAVDGRPLLRADIGPSDTRFHASLSLTPGPHDFLLYHVNTGGPMRFAVGWKRPDSAVFQIMDRGAFGTCFGSVAGPMEMRDHPLLADFTTQQLGECFISDDDQYAFSYRFTATAHAEQPITYRWDFGDGQSLTGDDASAAAADHAYLHAGVYPVKLAITVGPHGDAQTSRIAVQRNYLHLVNAIEIEPSLLCSLINGDRPSVMSADDLGRAARLYLDANDLDGALRAAGALAGAIEHKYPVIDLSVLRMVSAKLLERGRVDDAVTLWSRAAPTGPLGVHAAAEGANLALWWQGDASRALALLAAAPSGDPAIQSLYARALLLAGKPEQARAVLQHLQPADDPARHVALAGAAARSVEFYITENDPDSGEAAWEQWQQRFPADFLEGYSLLLRVRLLTLRHREPAAAAIAEDFARAMPQSSYAPQLLNLASTLLAATDPAKSGALRQLLKQRYPEDPQSQN
jgi:hypothetical protein